jgi:hypothetical protein
MISRNNKKKKIVYLAIMNIILFSNTLLADYWGDYTFFSLKNNTSATLIDFSGKTYHSWTFGSTKKTAYSAYLLPGGTVVRSYNLTNKILNGGGMTGAIQKVDWNNNVLWDFAYSSDKYCLHHDICPMPNGNILLISYDVKTAAEATQAGCSSAITVWSEKIIEVKQTGPTTGEIVWEWKVWDHLCQNVKSDKSNYVTSISAHPELMNINYKLTQDFMHMNGLDYNADLDQITFSSHMLNEVYIIDHSTTKEEAAGHTGGKSGKGGDLLYRWGNPTVYGMPGTANFNVVHDAHWIPEGCPKANSLVGFNNNGGANRKSCVDIFMPPYNGSNYTINAGSAYLPLTYSWRNTFSGNATSNEGNSQQLPNGNSLVNVAMTGYVYEVDTNQNVVWTRTLNGQSSHVYRYTACYVAGTIAPAPTISKEGTKLISSIASSYQWFFNGEPIVGAIEQSYIPTKNGYYRVQIKNESGCESYLSEKVLITSTSEVEEINANELIYPNPVNEELNISTQNIVGDYEITIFNSIGVNILSVRNSSTIDMSNFENGVYFLNITDNIRTRNIKFILIK